MGEEQPHKPRVDIGARKVEPLPRPDIQYEQDVVYLELPCAVVQQPRRVSQEYLIVRRGAPNGGVSALGQGRRGGRGGALLLGLPGSGGGRGRRC